MFVANLRNYVLGDNRRRLRDNRVSLIIALAFSALMLMWGESESSIALEGLTVLAISMLCLTVYSCAAAPQKVAGRRRPDPINDSILYRPVTRRLALLGVIIIALLAALPAVEGAALDRRLRRLTTNVPLDPRSIHEVKQTIDEAIKYKAKLPASSLPTVASALATTININLPKDMNGKVFGSFPEANGSTYNFAPIATNAGPDNYATIGLARPPNIAMMELIEMPLPRVSNYGPAFLVVKGLTATLDGYHLKHVVFQDMVLTYHGGPLLLENVYFFRCKFHLDANEESWKLLSAMAESINTAGWVNFSSMPQ